MVEIFKDDFENGYTPWDGAVAETGCVLEVSTVQARLGTFSSHAKNSDGGQAYSYKGFTAQNIVHHRFYVYIEADSGTIYAFLGGFSQYVPSPNPGIGITGADRHLILRYVDSAGSHYVESSARLSLKRWHCLEIMANKTLGEIRVWLDGVEVSDLAQVGLDLSGQAFNHIVNGVFAAYRHVDCYIDAVVVADSYIGPLPGEVPKYATLTGTVSDTTGSPIAGATVEATSIYTGVKFSATTNASGVYTMLVPLDTYSLQATANGYEPSAVFRVDALQEATYTVDFLLAPTPTLETFIDTDFRRGTLSPYTPEWLEGTYQFFTPTTDPLGTGAYGVIFKNGRIAGRYTFERGLGFIRATQTVAFPNTAALCGFLTLRTKAMMGSPNYLFWLDVWDNKWRTIYFQNGAMVYGDYPAVAPPEPNRKYKVTLELKMGAGDGEARLYIDDVLVWERKGLNNTGAGSAIEVIEIGLSIYEAGAVSYFYNSIVEGTVLSTHTLSGYVRDVEGKPLQYAVVAVGAGEMDPTRPGGGVIHTPLATVITDVNGYYAMTQPEGTYIVEAFKGPGKFDEWLRDAEGRVLDYAEKLKHQLPLYADTTLDFVLGQTLAPEPPAVTSDIYWNERCVWVFPYAWGGYSLKDGTATPTPQVTECLNALKTQVPNINAIDVRLEIKLHPTVPDMPILTEEDYPVTMEDIEAITKAAHERNLRVNLMMIGEAKVSDPAVWFENYLNLLLHPTPEQQTQQKEGVIEMCKRLGIEEFTLGGEWWWARREFEEGEWSNYWSHLIDEVRNAGYTGKITYHFQTPWPGGAYGPDLDKFLTYNDWIRKLDFIIIADWHISTFSPYNVDAPYEEVLKSWYQHPDMPTGYGSIPNFTKIYDKYKVPIVVNYGFRLRWGSPRTYGIPELPKDEHEQAVLYRASFEALASKPWCYGAGLEHFDVAYGPANPTCSIRDEYSTQIINAGLASHSVEAPPGKGALEVHAFADTKEVAATVEIVGVEMDTTPFVTYLDPGDYTLKATFNTQSETRTTTVVEGQVTREDFHFIAPPPKVYTLTIIAGTGGTTAPSPGSYSYTEGTRVAVTALPNTNYRFINWLLDGAVRTENPITVVMDTDHTLESVYEYVPPPPLTATITGTVIDKVTGSPVPGATVTCDGYADITEVDGSYIFENIPAKKYTIRVTKENYVETTISVDASSGGTITVDISISPVAPPPTPPAKAVGILATWRFPICSRFPNAPPCPIILNWAKRKGYIKEGA
jgi:hypothetical protein